MVRLVHAQIMCCKLKTCLLLSNHCHALILLGMHLVCYYPCYSHLHTFWPYHPYLLLQFILYLLY